MQLTLFSEGAGNINCQISTVQSYTNRKIKKFSCLITLSTEENMG